MRDSESLRLGSNPSPGARPIRRGRAPVAWRSDPSPGADPIFHRLILLILLFSLPAAAFSAATPWKTNPHGQLRLISNDDVAPAKGELWLGLHFQPAPEWYVYWKFAGDSGYPPKFTWTGSSGFKNPQLLWPAPTKFALPGDITEYGYEGEIVYPVRAELTGGPVVVKVQISYLTCNTSCVPYKYELTLKIPSGPKAVVNPEGDALIRRFAALAPPPGKSDDEILRSAPTFVKIPGQAAVARGSAAWIFLLAFLGGLLLNVMPCVLPVLSIKMLGLVQQGGQARGVIARGALASAAGVLASFVGLAAAAMAARSAGHAVGWGIQFQEPFFVGLLATIVILFGLNLWGVFEFRLPAIFGRFATFGQGETLTANFASGLFATLLATPCSAPFLGTAMGFALTQTAPVILGIFLAVGAGMALPYFVLAVLPQSLHWLPKPGPWMIRLKKVLAVLLFGTAVWLGWVLSHQLGALHPTPSPSKVKMGVAWTPFDEGAIAGYLADGRSVFVDVTADWCVTCKYNERFVLSDSDVVKVFQDQGIVMMQADWTSRDAAVTAFLQKHRRAGVPFYALYRPGQPPKLLSEFLTKRQVLDALGRK
jgi:thiol:disulfide interchange protein